MKAFKLFVQYARQTGGCLCLALPLTVSMAVAQNIPGYPASIGAYDSREVAMLPRYCMYTLDFRIGVPGGNNQTEIQRGYAMMGETFRHMHHYCWGLMKTNRAVILAQDPKVRQWYLSESIPEFDYVIRQAPADFVLLPEILTKKGENLLRLERIAEGITELERAVELKPDYWPPYVALSDYYKKVKNVAKARDWAERGLATSPDTKALQQRVVELGGKKPQPSTVTAPAKAQSPDKAASATPTPQTEPSANPVVQEKAEAK